MQFWSINKRCSPVIGSKMTTKSLLVLFNMSKESRLRGITYRKNFQYAFHMLSEIVKVPGLLGFCIGRFKFPFQVMVGHDTFLANGLSAVTSWWILILPITSMPLTQCWWSFVPSLSPIALEVLLHLPHLPCCKEQPWLLVPKAFVALHT